MNHSRELAQLGVGIKISFSSTYKKSLNVAADMVENIKKPTGHWSDKAKGWKKPNEKISFILRERSNMGEEQEKCWSNEP
jgi:hypothetical protein